MKLVLYLVAAAGIAVAGLLVWVRVAPSDPARWHVDPVVAPDPATPNWARIQPGEIVAPEGTLAARLEVALAREPNMRHLAGSLREGWASYVQRSRWIGYPDYISLRILPHAAGGETLAVLSRSRFGRSDLGVNTARLARLRTALQGD
ncbi:Uncharacterized conserved protein, DUF1499 family [Gemmobacter megaterium]|uniref:Uncharacterized conserved protein, DUF1499 family n=1 Tax=Gemmobacter megaterium TaxID=1086013 RepID=A0A1N7KJH0_9RHOB|nr:DUF1499 domain-containing protein [Gemmobacter megaterium]GGE02436.1 hypothetical protein GCM10011345_04700 [Gemmobacter megaterium]SIS61654.1 Uncharacterized conserved protein, DUF1499 family [Gemmobacter megaterium]